MWKDYLSMSRKEQRGFLVLSVIVVLLLITRLTLPLFYPKIDFSTLVNDSVPLTWVPIHSYSQSKDEDSPSIFHIQAFDPNNVSHKFLIELGLDEFAAGNWIRYIESGGRFRTPDDIKRIYGIKSATISSLKPFLIIEESNTSGNTEDFFTDNFLVDLNRVQDTILTGIGWGRSMTDTLNVLKSTAWFTQRYSVNNLRGWTVDSILAEFNANSSNRIAAQAIMFQIDINKADTAEWMLLRGIGPVISRRIVNYRRILGGFINVEQIKEVYGVSPVLFDDIKSFLKLDSVVIEKIDINTASVRRLRDHPYLDFYQAKAIVDTRNAQGNYKEVHEIFNLEPFSEIDPKKIIPYLCAETGLK